MPNAPRPKIILADVELQPMMSGALLVPEFQTLIIADLHLEQGAALARRGIRVPPYDSNVTLSLLEAVLHQQAPKRVVFLGDTFHDIDGEAEIEASLLRRLQVLSRAHDCFWICGNHDPLPPRQLHGQAADHMLLGPIILRHDPRRLKREEFEISGHLHPGCGVTQRGRRVSGKCFITDQRRLMMPAFGAYTGAMSVRSPAFNGLFENENARALMIGRERLYSFPYDRLG